jgi:GTP pyrophosphokinase/guanosine-3',5'-bis(diphosphate) 3'-pyrophosphohydrolase
MHMAPAGASPLALTAGVPAAANDARASGAPAASPSSGDEAIPPFHEFAAHVGYLKPDELARVGEAYAFAIEAHRGQSRQSGEPYVTHPIAVAINVAEWRLDVQAIMAALLHDVLEDTGATKAQLAERFGNTVADLVDGLSKLDKMEFQSAQEAQAENFRKMLLAMSRDLRVILIKLADRLHNMATLGAMRPDKRRRIARETLEIYAPIANRLGLNKLCRELEEHCFEQVNPWRFRVLSKAVQTARGNRSEMLGRIFDSIRQRLKEAGITAELRGREKTTYSIYRKMREKRLTFSQVLDIFGVRVVVKDPPSCYLTLGILHALFKPIPGKFKDYIAIPKANGYQSLHTTLIGPNGMPLEVQVRTVEMHHVAQDGVASHWLYKTSESDRQDLAANTHLWLQSLLDLQKGSDSKEFLEHVKVDLFPDEVYVFTPKGKILALPRGATCVDFAYAVHTAVGDCCVAAKVNHTLVPLRTELNNGDRVDIVTDAEPNPNAAWLSFVKTARARSKIRHFLKTRQHDEAVRLGERFLDQALRPIGGAIGMIGEATWGKLVQESGLKSRHDLLAEVGLGRRNATIDARRLMVLGQFDSVETGESVALAVTGEENAALKFGPCCRPILGDAIVGVLTQGSGITIHAQDCAVLKRQRPDRDRLVDVEWDVPADRLFDVSIIVEVRNARGVLAAVATAIATSSSNIHNVFMDEKRADTVTTLNFTIEVANRKHLAQVMRNVRKVSEVLRVSRQKAARK